MNSRVERCSITRSNRCAFSLRVSIAAISLGLCGAVTVALGQTTSSPQGICPISSAPVPDKELGEVLTMNRALAFSAGDPDLIQAIRVTIESVSALQHEFLVGSIWWVQAPEAFGELKGTREPVPGFPSFLASTLGCGPFFQDWNGVCVDGNCAGGFKGVTCQNGVCIGGPNDQSTCSTDSDCPGEPCSNTAECGGGILNVYGEMIVPGASFSVSVVAEDCDLNDPASFANASLTMTTSTYGNVAGLCSDTGCAVPDNGPVAITDALAILAKFAGVPGAIRKMRADLEPSRMDFYIGVTDVLQSLAAFSGLKYLFLSCRPHAFGSICFGGPTHLQNCVNDLDCRIPLCP